MFKIKSKKKLIQKIKSGYSLEYYCPNKIKHYYLSKKECNEIPIERRIVVGLKNSGVINGNDELV